MSTSQLEPVLEYLRDTLGDIPGVAHSYAYQPVVVKPGEFPDLTRDTYGAINYWTVTAESTTEQYLTNRETQLRHEIVLRGFAEVLDFTVTESAFRQLVTRIADRFRDLLKTEPYALAVDPLPEILGPVQFPIRGQHRLLAETFLVHYAEGRLTVQELVTP